MPRQRIGSVHASCEYDTNGRLSTKRMGLASAQCFQPRYSNRTARGRNQLNGATFRAESRVLNASDQPFELPLTLAAFGEQLGEG